MDYQDFGRKVRTVRLEMGMTQEALAEQVGISASFLGHIERGTRVASLDTLVALCQTLRVSPEYLLHGSLGGGYQTPPTLTSDERAKLQQFLHMAEEAVRGLKD